MISAAELLTLICLFIPAYVYVGYPAVLFLLIKVFRVGKSWKQEEIEPAVTMIISCYNEVDVIETKIKNCLSIDYPIEKLNFIFVSDGSDDGTDDAITSHASNRIMLVRQEGRLGKTSGLNLAVPQAEGEIVIFSDANAMYKEDAIRKLVRNFSDKAVGYVVGAALYTDSGHSGAAASENAYWNYEIFMKQLESHLHSVVGGDGAIYAIRKKLYRELHQKDINDFVNPLQIILQGYRGVFDNEAICFEETAGSFDKEGARKRRIVNRSFRGLMTNARVMSPAVSGLFSIEVISHKLLRWLAPFFIMGATVLSLYVSFSGNVLFQVLTGLILTGYALSWLGYIYPERARVLQLAYYFYLVNYQSFMGIMQFIGGDTQITWTSPRATENTTVKQNRKMRIACITFIVWFLSLVLWIYSL